MQSTRYSSHMQSIRYSSHVQSTRYSSHMQSIRYSSHMQSTRYSSHVQSTCYFSHVQSTRYSSHILVQPVFFSKHFRNTLKYQISQKSTQWESSCSMRKDRQTDRQTMTTLTVALLKFAKSPKYFSVKREVNKLGNVA